MVTFFLTFVSGEGEFLMSIILLALMSTECFA